MTHPPSKGAEEPEEFFFWRYWVELHRSFVLREKFERFGKETTPELAEAARLFGLDPANAAESAVLVRILADLMFRKRKTGRPSNSTKWKRLKLVQLWFHYTLVEKENPRISFNAAVPKMRDRFPDFYRTIGGAALRRRLSEAERVILDHDPIFGDQISEDDTELRRFLKLAGERKL
jgi:hypothetical protein